jgi:tetratricopeptide (TPR) repeat protein
MMPLTWLRLSTFSHPLLLWDDAARRIKDDKSCITMDRILNNRGIELTRLGRYSEAIADFTRSVDIVKQQEIPELSELSSNYYNRGVTYLQNKQFQLALNDFNTIKIEPTGQTWRGFHFYKAQALEGLHDLTAARELYAKSCVDGMTEGCTKQKELEALVK